MMRKTTKNWKEEGPMKWCLKREKMKYKTGKINLKLMSFTNCVRTNIFLSGEQDLVIYDNSYANRVLIRVLSSLYQLAVEFTWLNDF